MNAHRNRSRVRHARIPLRRREITLEFLSRLHRLAVASIGAVLAASCATFSNVRSAQVRTGATATVQASFAGAPGNAAGWFWNGDCVQRCSQPIAGADFVFAYGSRPAEGSPHTLGFGISGLWPYFEGYWQLGKSETHPFGVGARLGLPLGGWSEHQIYGRTDLVIDKNTRLLWNPGVFLHTGQSGGIDPTSGTFVGLVQGIGLERDIGRITLVPSAALVIGHAQRKSLGQMAGPETRAFGTVALSITFGAKR
jgi:hypothetical protein